MDSVQAVPRVRRLLGCGSAANISVAPWCAVSYAQQRKTIGFFSNVTTVLSLSGFVGGDTERFRGPENHPSPTYVPNTPAMGRQAHNFGLVRDKTGGR